MESGHFSANGYDFSEEYDAQANRGFTTVQETGPHQQSGRDSVPVKSGTLKADGYEDGHIIAVSANAPHTPMNHMAQDRHLNRSGYKTVENAEARIGAKTDGTSIARGRDVSFHMNPEQDKVAENILVNDVITHPDGYQEQIHLSFTNLPQQDLEAIDAEMEKMDFDGELSLNNPGMGSMSPEELESYLDTEALSIREEFEPTHIVSSNETVETDSPNEENGLGAEDSGIGPEDGVDDGGIDDGGIDDDGGIE